MNTYRAMQKMGAVGGKGATGGRAGDAMDTDSGSGVDGHITEMEVKAMVESVLDEESLVGRRAVSMDIDDLLALLSAFNEKGVHFA